MGNKWIPIAGPVFVQVDQGLWRFTADRCELVGSDGGKDYPTGYRLCSAIDDGDGASVLNAEVVAALTYALNEGWDEYNITLPETQPHLATLRALLDQAQGGE